MLIIDGVAIFDLHRPVYKINFLFHRKCRFCLSRRCSVCEVHWPKFTLRNHTATGHCGPLALILNPHRATQAVRWRPGVGGGKEGRMCVV